MWRWAKARCTKLNMLSLSSLENLQSNVCQLSIVQKYFKKIMKVKRKSSIKSKLSRRWQNIQSVKLSAQLLPQYVQFSEEVKREIR